MNWANEKGDLKDDLAVRHWDGTPPVHERYIRGFTGVPWYAGDNKMICKQNYTTHMIIIHADFHWFPKGHEVGD